MYFRTKGQKSVELTEEEKTLKEQKKQERLKKLKDAGRGLLLLAGFTGVSALALAIAAKGEKDSEDPSNSDYEPFADPDNSLYIKPPFEDYDEECEEALSVRDAADIWLSSGMDEDYTFGYTEEELRAVL